jgi:hypothetical protein
VLVSPGCHAYPFIHHPFLILVPELEFLSALQAFLRQTYVDPFLTMGPLKKALTRPVCYPPRRIRHVSGMTGAARAALTPCGASRSRESRRPTSRKDSSIVVSKLELAILMP